MVSTFHSFCVRLLRRDGDASGGNPAGLHARLHHLRRRRPAGAGQVGLPATWDWTRSSCSTARRCRASATPRTTSRRRPDLYKDATDPKTARLAAVFEQYEERPAAGQRAGFRRPAAGSRAPAAARRGHARAPATAASSYLLIDEYQDTNRSQYELMRLLTGGAPERLRGGRRGPVHLRLARRRHPQHPGFRAGLPRRRGDPPGAELPLDARTSWTRPARWSRTTRSARARRCGPRRRRASRSACTRPPTRESEALFIADTIEKTAGADPRGARRDSLPHQRRRSRQIEEALRRYGRKYLVVGGFSFYQRAEVKDALAYLKLLISPPGLRQPAARDQHAGARHRQHHRRADGAVRARPELVPVGRASGGCSTTGASGAARRPALGDVPQPDARSCGTAAGRQPLDEALRLILDRTGYRKMLETDDAPESRIAPGEPGRTGERGGRGRRARRGARRISWTTRRWSRDADQLDDAARRCRC